MADDLLSQYIDRKSIKDDTVFMVEEFDKIYKEFQKINSLKVTLDLSSSFGKAAGVVNEMKKSDDALAASIQNVNKEFVQLAPVIKNADAAIQQINSGLDEGARALAELKLRAAENAKAQKDLVKAYQDGKVSLEDYTRQAGALIQRDQDLKVQIADLTSQQKQFAKENNAVAGSMDQAGIRLGRLREEYRSLTDEEKAAPFGKNLKAAIDALDPAIKQADGSIGNFQRNIGNYSGAVDVLKGRLGEITNELQKVNGQGNANVQVVDQLTKEYELLDNIVKSQANGFVSMREEIKNNQVAIEQLSLVYGEDSDVVQGLIKENGKLRDTFSDLKAAQKAVGSDTFAFDALLQGGQALVGIYGAAQGAAQLLGDQNEDLQKAMVRLQAAMALVQGVQAAVNALQKEGALIQGIYAVRTTIVTAATRVWTFVTGAATVAARTFNAALVGIGLGALLVLIPLAAKAIESLTSKTLDGAEAFKTYADNLKFVVELNDKLIAGIESFTKRQLAAAKARGASEEEVTKITISGLEEQKKQYDKVLASREKQADEADDFLRKVAARQVEADDDQIQSAQNVLSEFNKLRDKRNELEDSIYVAQQESIAARNKAAEEESKKQKEELEKRAKALEDYDKRQLAAQFEILKLKKQDQIDSTNDFGNNEDNPFLLRVSSLKTASVLEANLIQAQANFEIATGKHTSKEIEAIRLKSQIDIANVYQRTEKTITDITKQQIEKRKQDAQDAETKRLDDIGLNLQTRLNQNKVEQTAELKIIIENYKNGLISTEEYEKQKNEIIVKYSKKNLLAQIESAKKVLDDPNLDPKQRAEAEAKLNDLLAQLYDEDSVNFKNAQENKEEAIQKMHELEKQFAEESLKLVETLVTSKYEIEKNLIQEQIDLLEQKRQKDIEVASATIINEQQKAATLIEINARADAQKKVLEQQQKEANIKKARTERAFQVFSIAGNTAIAVSKALAEYPYPYSSIVAGLVGALGAVQIATVLATPIPQYRFGTKDHIGGLAIVGDGGKKEYGVTPAGEVFETPDKPTIMDLPKHTVVYPDANEFRKAALSGLHSRYPAYDVKLINNYEYMEKKMEQNTKEIRALRMEIRNKRENHYQVTPYGLMAQQKGMNDQIEYMNNAANWSS